MANSIKQVTVKGSKFNLGSIETAAIAGVEQGENIFTGGNNHGVKLLVAGAANTVTAADSGKIIVFNVAAATLCTLPAPKIGMKFTFITSILATGDHEIQAATDGHGLLWDWGRPVARRSEPM